MHHLSIEHLQGSFPFPSNDLLHSMVRLNWPNILRYPNFGMDPDLEIVFEQIWIGEDRIVWMIEEASLEGQVLARTERLASENRILQAGGRRDNVIGWLETRKAEEKATTEESANGDSKGTAKAVTDGMMD